MWSEVLNEYPVSSVNVIKPMKKPTSAIAVFAKYALNITTLCLTT